MARASTEGVNIRTTAELEALLKLPVELEGRLAASMIEALVLVSAPSHGLESLFSSSVERAGRIQAG